MNRFLLIGLLLGCLLPARAQTEAWAEIAAIRERYTHLSDYEAGMEYKIYSGHRSQTLVDVQNGQLQVWGNCYRMVLGDLETVKNGQYVFQLDGENKEMDVVPVAQTDIPGNVPMFSDFSSLDQLLQKKKAVTRELREGYSILTFDMTAVPGSEYEKIIVYLHPDGTMNKLILFFSAPMDQYALDGDYKPRVEVTYLKQSFSAGLSAAHFSEKKYFTVVNGQIVPHAPYKNFKLF